jgi:diaminohydroxyphosphoribosylaminopyrimidine deaminase/5-amino-6-(5-phosphoribosylamino)uracil reductase
MTDRDYIKRTIRLAKKAAGRTSPNPMVGAIIVKAGRIIAEDFHRVPGTPHAEALVLAEAGAKAKGSVLYVNLEPCCHTNKRTPPCTKVIIATGVKKVVVAMEDPNPQVSGKGVKELRNAGIEVVTGVLDDEAGRLNEAYVKFITKRVPFVTLKVAMTLDGKIAMPSGESKWITGERARRYVHRMRSSVDAVITAIGTVLADDPELTARFRGAKNPMRVVIDPELKMPENARILDIPPETVIVTGAGRSKRLDEVRSKGVKLFLYKKRLHLQWLMERLGAMDVTSVMIEGGSSLASHALEDGVVDKVVFFIAPKIIGGRDSFPAVGGNPCASLSDAYRLRDIKVRTIGEDILVEGYVER